MGATLPTSNPPIRIAEEYSMIDCISGGRMVAGMPLGTSQDVNLCYGIRRSSSASVTTRRTT